MARGGISFEGIGFQAATFKADGSISAVAISAGADALVGKVVTVVDDGVVGFGDTGDPIRGVIDKYEEDGHVTVQFRGFRENVPGVSAKLPLANNPVAVNYAGAVSVVATAVTGAYAVEVDNSANVNTATIFIG